MLYRKVAVVVFRRIGVSIPPVYYFCGIDEKRIVFFKNMLLTSMPSTNHKEVIHPMLVLSRQREIIDIGSCYWNFLDDNRISFAFEGLNSIKIQAQQYDIDAHDNHLLKADWFEEGDIIEIRKNNWGNSSWLSQVATSRQYGAKFSEVFPEGKFEFESLPNCLKSRAKKIKDKIVIFEGQQPNRKSLKKFF